MTAEQFLRAWLRSELLEPRRLTAQPVNYYDETLKDTIAAKEKEMAAIPKTEKRRAKGKYTKRAVRRRRKEGRRHA